MANIGGCTVDDEGISRVCGKPVGADVFLEAPEGRVLCVAAGGGVSAGGGVEVSIGAPGGIPQVSIDAGGQYAVDGEYGAYGSYDDVDLSVDASTARARCRSTPQKPGCPGTTTRPVAPSSV
ncbi:hypothetical protein R4P64_33410 [Rhodococcus sp. IEGM 1366]|uniref:hypothetical protein n=1 Tax=Rhodococcus sp. IEGM 1366 TaxID=3082223 RepID=UPI0029557E07|nr:hypothetical protein [Rhodococcus sp. IEGM 1366]MDV8071412.1 hypothetical protein [Rhodococcus sp. IEGM 1366]